MCLVQDWQLSLSYFLSYFSMMVSDAILCTLHNLNTLYSYVEHVMTICLVQEWQLLLSYFLCCLPLIASDAISCPLYNFNNLWNIIIIFHSYVEQVLTMCGVQGWQLSLSELFPLSGFRCIFGSLHNFNTLWNIILIIYSYVEQVIVICCVQEWKLPLSYFPSYFPLIFSDAILCPLHNLNTR